VRPRRAAALPGPRLPRGGAEDRGATARHPAGPRRARGGGGGRVCQPRVRRRAPGCRGQGKAPVSRSRRHGRPRVQGAGGRDAFPCPAARPHVHGARGEMWYGCAAVIPSPAPRAPGSDLSLIILERQPRLRPPGARAARPGRECACAMGRASRGRSAAGYRDTATACKWSAAASKTTRRPAKSGAGFGKSRRRCSPRVSRRASLASTTAQASGKAAAAW
jgi:hypothetical protein